MNNSKINDVIIVGAGPVGLFLACELALAKCSVLVLEKTLAADSPLKRLPFGIRGLSAPTIEALDRRGLLGQLEIHKRMKDPHQGAAKGARRQGGHFAGIPFLDGNIDPSRWKYRLESSTQTSLLSEMQELESIFERQAKSLGVDVLRGVTVTEFRQSPDEVVVQAGQQSFTGEWLVGCDGARSVIRKCAGFDFAGTEPEFTGYTTLMDIDDAEKLKPGRNVTSRGMYMQSQPGYVMIQDFDGGAFHGSEKPITLEHVQEVLRRVSDTDVTIKALHFATTWTDRARQATSYRKGRVLLAGDAAHIHSPLGGQGLNLGLGDAMNLGWKLAETIMKHSPISLLDSYQSERFPVGEQVLDWSRAQVAVMKPNPEGRALNAILREVMNTVDGATYFAGRVWGVDIRYDLGGEHPLIGRSVPNFEFANGEKVNELMRDGCWLILDFSEDDFLKTFAASFQGRLKYHTGRAKEQFGLSAALIRPDGVVAWVSDGPTHSSIKDALA